MGKRPATSARRLAHACVVALAIVAAAGSARETGDGARTGVPAPEFTHATPAEWLNSAPITLASLRGRVVLVDFWTFDCWNCFRSFPWLKALEERFADEAFSVIGVHTPEFEHEHDVESVRAKIREFGLTHPVMIDNDFSYWHAMGNRYWPAFYLIDRHGLVRKVYVGETHVGDSQARRVRSAVASLLAEQ